jgi:beta-galactosidase
MQTDGVSVSHGGADFVKAVDEINKMEGNLDPSAQSDFIKRSRTGILWSQRNVMDIESYRHHSDWDTWQHIYTYYQGLKRMGVDVVFMTEDDDYDPARIPFLVVPAYQMMSRELVARLESYAARGGHLIISTRSCLKDQKGHLWEAKIQQPIWKLIGGEIEFYDHLPSNLPGMVAFNGRSYPWHVWGTVVKPGPDVDSWGIHEDQFYKGKSSILHRTLEKGGVTYVGAWSDKWEMEYDVLRRVYGRVLGKLPFDLPPYVFVLFRQGLWIAVNYTDKVTEIPVPKGADVFSGDRNLPPGGVLVWRE